MFLPTSTGALLGTFAVTGGTGAYEGVSGYAEFSFDGTGDLNVPPPDSLARRGR